MKAMLLFVALVTLTTVVSARRLIFDDPKMPITTVETSFGIGNHERIVHLEAVIYHRHLTNRPRVQFPRLGPLEDYYQAIRAAGDERGHLVSSEFSGPPEWYNLTPQNVRVNRNFEFPAITKSWYQEECQVRQFLQRDDDNRRVSWTIDMTYARDSNRPNEYRLRVIFHEDSYVLYPLIDYLIQNPFAQHDNTSWICLGCYRSREQEPDCHSAAPFLFGSLAA